MVFIKKIRMTPQEYSMVENAIAQAAKNAADIEYISMMTDIDLDDDEFEGTDEITEDEVEE